MCKKLSLKILLTVMMLSTSACSKESPELVPCMCDGSESTLGLFDCMCEPMKKRPVKRLSYIRNEARPQTLYIDREKRDAYYYLHQRRENFAPIALDHVDFRIKKGRKYEQYDTKLGNYRFRIFGCRRENKNVFLNKGRAMQKDMHFFDIFYEQMNEYYPVVVDRGSPYYMESERLEYPEYLVSAEITDYFMNICDEFDWNNVKQKKLRSGTSEITVTWRVMDLTKDEVFCKGTTTGYGQISEGEPNGETLLVERAFEDALNKLPEIDCFNSTVAQRIHPDDLQSQINELKEMERRNASIRNQYARELKGIDVLQNCVSGIPTNIEDIKDEFFETGDSCDSANLVKGTYVNGVFVEDEDGMVGGHYVDGKFIEDCTEPCPPLVRGRYENGKFVEDDKGTVFGRFVDGKFAEEKILSGNVVRGYYTLDGRFVESKDGTIYGYYADNGKFIEELDNDECDYLFGRQGIDERSGFSESYSQIDGTSGVTGSGFDNITPLPTTVMTEEECAGVAVPEFFTGVECEAGTASGAEEIVIETTETCYTPCSEPVAPCPDVIRGRYDENGNFVEDEKGEVFGRYINGKFKEEKILKGEIVRGSYTPDGRFVEDPDGGVYGRYIEGRFVEEISNIECPEIQEAGGVLGGGSYSNFSYIDANGECRSAGVIIDERGDIVSGAAACEGKGVFEERKLPCVVKAPCKVKKKPCRVKAPCLTPEQKDDCTESELEFANAVVEAGGATGKTLTAEDCAAYLEKKGISLNYGLNSTTFVEKTKMIEECRKVLGTKASAEFNSALDGTDKALDKAIATEECMIYRNQYADSFASDSNTLIEKAKVLDACRRYASDKAYLTGCKALMIAEERGGLSSSGADDKTKPQMTPIVRQEPEVLLDSECRALEIKDNNSTVIESVGEKTAVTGDYLLEVPVNAKDQEIIENANISANNLFCIQNNPPYDNLNPQNMYKVRASVVSVENVNGKKGAGLIIADNLILTSADLMVKDNNNFDIRTINNRRYKATAFRINPNKNVAVLMLTQKVKYTPLPMSLELPEVEKDILLTLGLLDLDTEGEGYLDNKGKVVGYRWSADKTAEIIVDTYVQSVTVGGALIDANGNVVGIAHESRKLDDSKDIFIPIETALKALDLEICGHQTGGRKPVTFKIKQTPLADAIDASKGSKAPKVMKSKERK